MLASEVFFTGVILMVACERLVELKLNARNCAESVARGGKEFGAWLYPWMATAHTAILIGALLEVWLLHRAFHPVMGLVLVTVCIFCQMLRWWVIRTLGSRWTTRVFVVPGESLIEKGPFRFLKHPNYLAVWVEGIALPMIHNAWIAAACFTVANSIILLIRLHYENSALKLLKRRTTL